MPWRTYGQLWSELKLTRGALDRLVQGGETPWTTGADLIPFLRDHGVDVTDYEPSQMYYSVMQAQAGDAVARLTGQPSPLAGVRVGTDGGAKLVSDIVECSNCNATIERAHLNSRGCRVCAPTARDYGTR